MVSDTYTLTWLTASLHIIPRHLFDWDDGDYFFFMLLGARLLLLSLLFQSFLLSLLRVFSLGLKASRGKRVARLHSVGV